MGRLMSIRNWNLLYVVDHQVFVYDAGFGSVWINLIKLLDGSAHAEAEATDRRTGTETRMSGPRRR